MIVVFPSMFISISMGHENDHMRLSCTIFRKHSQFCFICSKHESGNTSLLIPGCLVNSIFPMTCKCFTIKLFVGKLSDRFCISVWLFWWMNAIDSLSEISCWSTMISNWITRVIEKNASTDFCDLAMNKNKLEYRMRRKNLLIQLEKYHRPLKRILQSLFSFRNKIQRWSDVYHDEGRDLKFEFLSTYNRLSVRRKIKDSFRFWLIIYFDKLFLK